jgi:hypothetical protein
MGIRVLIDAGAQILEMDNLTLAKTWLDIDYEAPAVVYFEKDNKPWVLYRKISIPIPCFHISQFVEHFRAILTNVQVKDVIFLCWHHLSLMTWATVLCIWMKHIQEERT